MYVYIPLKGRGHPDSCVKQDSEVGVDQTVEKAVDSHVHIWSILAQLCQNQALGAVNEF